MTTADPQFDGMYGPFTITSTDREEVQRYRICLLVSGISLSAGLLQWWLVGGHWAWLWLLPLGVSLGLALQWIHIYLRPLHQALQLFWLLGCLGWLVLMPLTFVSNIYVDPATMPGWLQAIVGVNPVSLLVTAIRGIMAGTVTAEMVGFALAAPAVIATVCVPLALRLYGRER